MLVVMLDPEGEELWRVYPGDDENYRIRPGGVLVVDGELLMSFSDPYYYDEEGEWQAYYESTIFFERYDMSGNLSSEFDFTGLIPNFNSIDNPTALYKVTQMQYVDSENILLSGHSGLEGFLINMDTTGDIEWFRELAPYPFDEETDPVIQYTHIHHVLQTSDGGFLFTGEYRSSVSQYHPSGIQTAFALKVDEHGCLVDDCEVVGIDEYSLDNSSFKVYPNPTRSDFTVDYQINKRFDNAEIQVANVLGQIELSIPLSNSESQVTIQDNLSPGIYILQLIADGQRYGTQKLLVE